MNEIFEKQQKLLEVLQSKHPDYLQLSTSKDFSKGQLVAYVKDMQYFFNVEVQELIMAIGNEDSAIFKPWKAAYNAKQAETYVPTAIKPKLEAIDLLCFTVNICLATGIKPWEVHSLYNTIYENNLARHQEDY